MTTFTAQPDHHYETRTDTGVDLYSYCPEEPCEIAPNTMVTLPLGVSADISTGEIVCLRPDADVLAEHGVRPYGPPQILTPNDSGEVIYLQVETVRQPRCAKPYNTKTIPHDIRVATAVTQEAL